MSSRQVYQLGEWTVEPSTNELRRDGRSVQLDGKAMDVLAHLLSQAGEVVATEEILAAVWPDRVVEQSTVHRRINQIRRALGDDPKAPVYIRTIVRRGYQVVAPVSVSVSIPVNVVEVAEGKDDGAPDENGTGQYARAEYVANTNKMRPYFLWAIALLPILAVVGWLLWNQQNESEDTPKPVWQQSFADTAVIAVLPFRQTVDPGLEYLAPAVRNEISQRMHTLDSITLVADYSAVKVVETTHDVREIGQILHADYVIEGYVRSDGDVTGVAISLSDTSTGLQVWQHEYQRQLDQVAGIFALYDEIAKSLTVQLGVYLDEDLSEYYRPVPPPTGDIEAYNLLRRAFVARSQQRYADAVKLAEAAIARDPEFHSAHAMKANGLWLQAENGLLNQREGFTAARAAFERMLELAPDNAGAYVGLAGMAARVESDFPKSKRLYEKAISLGASPEFAWRGIGELYFNNGRYAEALQLYQQTATVNPLDSVPQLMIGRIYARTGETAKAREVLEQAVRSAGPADSNLFIEYLSFIANTDIERAQEIVSQAPAYMPVWYPSFVQSVLGNPEPRRAILRQMEARRDARHVSAWLLCLMHLAVEQYEEHIAWFNTSIEEEGVNHFIYDHFYGVRPDYWQKLKTWATTADDADEAARRTKLVNNHERKVQALMQNMWLD